MRTTSQEGGRWLLFRGITSAITDAHSTSRLGHSTLFWWATFS